MMLPLPNPAPADRSRTAPRRPSLGRSLLARHCLPSRRPAPCPLALLRISNTARRWTATRPGWSPARTNSPPVRATASRAKGVSPDDRSLETLADPLGSVPGRGPGRCRRHHGGDDAAIRRRASSRSRGRPARPAASRMPRSTTSRRSRSTPRNASIHEDFAGLYRDWVRHGPGRQAGGPARRVARPPDQRGQVRQGRSRARGKELLHDAMDQDLAPDSIYWAKELLNVAADDLDAHYVLAAEALEERAPNVPEIKRHLEVLEKVKAPAVRRLWIRARLADLAGDDAALAAALAEARALPPSAPSSDAVNRFARLRLTAMEIRGEADGQQLAGQVEAAPRAGQGAGQARGTAPGAGRAAPVAAGADPAVPDGALGQAAARGQEGRRRRWSTPSRSTWRRSSSRPWPTAASPTSRRTCPMPTTCGSAASPTAAWRSIDRALQVARRPRSGRRSQYGDAPAPGGRRDDPGQDRRRRAIRQGRCRTSRPCSTAPSRGSRRSAICSPARSTSTARAWPASWPGPTPARRAGQAPAEAPQQCPGPPQGSPPPALPDIAEAQAKYGVALVLAQEQNLGRQYLQNALRLGSLEPQYQLWAAWTILQAGYPEEAEPIVQSLLHQVDQGNAAPRDGGDAPPAPGRALPGPPEPRRPEEGRRGVRQGARRRAGRDADGRHAAGADRRPARPVRPRPGAARRGAVAGQGGRRRRAARRPDPRGDRGRRPRPARCSKTARGKYPRSAELAGLEAALLVKDGKPAEADAALERFLRDEPENVKRSS